MHTVKIAECLLLFHSQFDGENMYMSMTEPSQDYVPASQVGLLIFSALFQIVIKQIQRVALQMSSTISNCRNQE